MFLIMVEKVIDLKSLEAGVAHEADTVALLFTTLVELSYSLHVGFLRLLLSLFKFVQGLNLLLLCIL